MSLRFKVLGSFALIVLASLAASVGMGSKIMRNRYEDFAYRMDVSRARALARGLSEGVLDPQELTRGMRLPMGFGESDDVLPNRQPSPVAGQAPLMMHGEGRGWMNRMMDRIEFAGERPGAGAEAPGLNSFVITDPEGRVLLDMADYGKNLLRPREGSSLAAIGKGEDVIGFVYWGQMVPGRRNSAAAELFRVVGMATWLLTVLVFLAAMGLGLLLTLHIVRPVKKLNKATAAVKDGDLSVRVNEQRNDELGDLARGFNSMTLALESADIQRRRLIADSAHELRTPVSLIRARIEMMEEGVYPLDKEGLTALSGEAERLVHLVEELRILADLESPRTQTELQHLDITTLLDKAVSAAKPESDRRGISISSIAGEETLFVDGDENQIHRLISNLLSNALKYAESAIDIDLAAVNDTLVLQIEDDGMGIPQSDWEKVFDRYYRVDSSRSRDSGGTGLGLAICREIVRNHGGTIVVDEPKKRGGACIVVRMPLDS